MMNESVEIDVGDGLLLSGDWTLPEHCAGAIVFAHGSGSGRFSVRNRSVARALQQARFATLLLDLLTSDEEAIDNVTRELRFDIPLLARRVVAAVDWVAGALPATQIGLFGASTGAAAALIAASARPRSVSAVVSRGGRPDLAADALALVRAPTLLIVGGDDTEVIALNRRALRSLACRKELAIVAGATHLFEEPGALEQVAALAGAWFTHNLRSEDAAGDDVGLTTTAGGERDR